MNTPDYIQVNEPKQVWRIQYRNQIVVVGPKLSRELLEEQVLRFFRAKDGTIAIVEPESAESDKRYERDRG